MGILSWLDSFFGGAASAIGKTVSDVVHWALRGITSIVLGTFGVVTRSWHALYTDTAYYAAQLRKFIAAAEHAAAYILTVKIPGLLRWAGREFAVLAGRARALALALAHDVAALADRIRAAAAAITRWVYASVWAPLLARAKAMYADLLKWGYTAWWWVTHLQALADSLAVHLVLAIEKRAWQMAGMLGRFALSLVAHNARRLALLTEDIVTAVL